VTATLPTTAGEVRRLARVDLRPNGCGGEPFAIYILGLGGPPSPRDGGDRPQSEIRRKRERSAIGHLPFWLATNHFMGEGFWFWVIPLRGKTSLGVVYDKEIFPWREVNSQEKLLEWLYREFPLFARDLPRRKILDYTALKDFSYDCAQTISPHRWALAGEAGRFTDPLYSPGSDLISVYNTLITDAILTDDPAELALKCRAAEQLMRVFYQGTVPSYAVSYDALGDQEAFTLKYVWELCVYFPLYVFPFVNDLFTDRWFLPTYLSKFARLGPINRGVQALVSGFYQWKKRHGRRPAGPVFNDFTELAPLKTAESAFYCVNPSADEAARLFDRHLANLNELARFVAAHVTSVVVGDRAVLTNARFVEGIDVTRLRFDLDEMRARWSEARGDGEHYRWSFDPFVLDRFCAAPTSRAVTVNGAAPREVCRV
jgi:hypothetical protein